MGARTQEQGFSVPQEEDIFVKDYQFDVSRTEETDRNSEGGDLKAPNVLQKRIKEEQKTWQAVGTQEQIAGWMRCRARRS